MLVIVPIGAKLSSNERAQRVPKRKRMQPFLQEQIQDGALLMRAGLEELLAAKPMSKPIKTIARALVFAG